MSCCNSSVVLPKNVQSSGDRLRKLLDDLRCCNTQPITLRTGSGEFGSSRDASWTTAIRRMRVEGSTDVRPKGYDASFVIAYDAGKPIACVIGCGATQIVPDAVYPRGAGGMANND